MLKLFLRVAEDGHPGKTQYDAFCVACHGPDGTGNPLLGAPNLADSVWLYGSTTEALTESIAAGRQGVMPAFADRLDDTQIRLLVAYLARLTISFLLAVLRETEGGGGENFSRSSRIFSTSAHHLIAALLVSIFLTSVSSRGLRAKTFLAGSEIFSYSGHHTP